MAADPEKVAAIRERPSSRTASEIRASVSAASYLRYLIKNFCELTSSFTDQFVAQKSQQAIFPHFRVLSLYRMLNRK